MAEKKCTLDDDNVCTHCGECNICDLDASKSCDNCEKCLDDIEEYRSLNIQNYIDEDIKGLPHNK